MDVGGGESCASRSSPQLYEPWWGVAALVRPRPDPVAPLVVGCGLAVSPLPLIQEGSGQGTPLKNDRAIGCGTNKKAQDGGGRRASSEP